MQRNRPPNLGLWSPPGGKLDTATGESPFASAAREAQEEIGISISPNDLHLAGVISEQGMEGNWLMFLFEVLSPLGSCPPPHPEGKFQFFTEQELKHLRVPQTDREMLWPLFWEHRRGFFAAHCQIGPEERKWHVLQSSHGTAHH